MSLENEGAPFVDDARREAVLRGVVTGFSADFDPCTLMMGSCG